MLHIQKLLFGIPELGRSTSYMHKNSEALSRGVGIQFLGCKGVCGHSFYVGPHGALSPRLEPDQQTQGYMFSSRSWRRPI